MAVLDEQLNDVILKTRQDEYFTRNLAKVTGVIREINAYKPFRKAVGKDIRQGLSLVYRDLLNIYEGTTTEQTLEGYKTGLQWKTFLMSRTQTGKSLYEEMKKAVMESGNSLEDFYRNMYYMEEVFGGEPKMADLDPESVPPVDERKPTTWEEYSMKHLANVPYSFEERNDYLAKALVGSFKNGPSKLEPGVRKEGFSARRANSYVSQLKKYPIFQQLCKNRDHVNSILKEGAKDPSSLYETGIKMHRPFHGISKKESDRILTKLKTMAPLMDGTQWKSSDWNRLVNSIRSIDLNDPNKSGEKKLQEILDNGVAYTKGRKSLRKDAADQKKFDQSLDVLSVLSEANEYARYAAQAVIDRTNEVRRGYDPNYKGIRLIQYGASKLLTHTNSRDEELKKTVKNELLYGKIPDTEEDALKVLDGKPFRSAAEPILKDPSVLPLAPKSLGKRKVSLEMVKMGMSVLAVDQKLGPEETKNAVAGLVALSKMPAYFNPLANSKSGKVVIDSMKMGELQNELQNDPVVTALSKKLESPEKRKELFGKDMDYTQADMTKFFQEYENTKKELQAAAPAEVKQG